MLFNLRFLGEQAEEMRSGGDIDCSRAASSDWPVTVTELRPTASHMLLTSLVQLASTLAEELETLRLQRDEAIHALNTVALAMAFLDQNGNVIYVNDVGHKLLSAPNGLLMLRRGRIIARQPEHQEIFRRFLQFGTEAAAIDEQHDHTLLLRSQMTETASLSVKIVRPDVVDGRSIRHYIFAAKTVGASDYIFSNIRKLFHLTDAEARIASALASGLPLADVASQLDIKVSTARTHLARVFQKTSTQQQSQLVSLLRDVIVPIQS